jgi:hypothetical protein
MAPEQAAGDAVDHRADLYAWGVLAYELLAGQHPFAGTATARQLIAAQIAETPAPLATVAPDVAAPLAAIVTHCLAKDATPGRRSAAEVLEALDAARAPIRAWRPTPDRGPAPPRARGAPRGARGAPSRSGRPERARAGRRGRRRLARARRWRPRAAARRRAPVRQRGARRRPRVRRRSGRRRHGKLAASPDCA